MTILKQGVYQRFYSKESNIKKEVKMTQISKTEDFDQEFSSAKEYDDKWEIREHYFYHIIESSSYTC